MGHEKTQETQEMNGFAILAFFAADLNKGPHAEAGGKRAQSNGRPPCRNTMKFGRREIYFRSKRFPVLDPGGGVE